MQLLLNFHRDMLSWVAQLPPDDIWILVIAMVIIACLLAWQGWRLQWRKRLIIDTPTSNIRSAAQGYVEVIGHTSMLNGPPIVAPLTQKHCVWYKYSIVEQTDNSTRNSQRTLRHGISDELFLLEDATGHCIIDPDDAIVHANEFDRWSERHEPGKRLIYREQRLSEDVQLYALGQFKTVGQGHATAYESQQQRAQALIIKWKHDPQQRRKFDKNNDGELDMDEWTALRIAAKQQAQNEIRHRQLQVETQPILPAVIVLEAPEDARQQFLLSVRDPDELAQTYHWYSLCFLIPATLCFAWLAYFLTLAMTI